MKNKLLIGTSFFLAFCTISLRAQNYGDTIKINEKQRYYVKFGTTISKFSINPSDKQFVNGVAEGNTLILIANTSYPKACPIAVFYSDKSKFIYIKYDEKAEMPFYDFSTEYKVNLNVEENTVIQPQVNHDSLIKAVAAMEAMKLQNENEKLEEKRVADSIKSANLITPENQQALKELEGYNVSEELAKSTKLIIAKERLFQTNRKTGDIGTIGTISGKTTVTVQALANDKDYYYIKMVKENRSNVDLKVDSVVFKFYEKIPGTKGFNITDLVPVISPEENIIKGNTTKSVGYAIPVVEPTKKCYILVQMLKGSETPLIEVVIGESELISSAKLD